MATYRGTAYGEIAKFLYKVLQKERVPRDVLAAWCKEIIELVLDKHRLQLELKSVDRKYQSVVAQLDTKNRKLKKKLLIRERKLEERKTLLLELVKIRMVITREQLIDQMPD